MQNKLAMNITEVGKASPHTTVIGAGGEKGTTITPADFQKLYDDMPNDIRPTVVHVTPEYKRLLDATATTLPLFNYPHEPKKLSKEDQAKYKELARQYRKERETFKKNKDKRKKKPKKTHRKP